MKITYCGKTYTYDEWHKEIVRQVEAGKKWCYDCKNYRVAPFCGYDESRCILHGSLDYGSVHHPDVEADTCNDYVQKDGKRWFEK